MLSHVSGNSLLDGSRDKEILLFQTQLLARIMVIVGVENLYDILCKIGLLYRLLVIALVKGIQLEALNRLRIPDAQSIYNTVPIAYNGKIVRNGFHALIAFLNKVASSVLINTHVYITAKFNFLSVFRPSQLKGIAVHQPVIGNLYLIAVSDLLLKHSVAVSDSAAVSRIAQRRKGIQKARR